MRSGDGNAITCRREKVAKRRRRRKRTPHGVFIWNLKHVRRFVMRWDQEAVALSGL